MTVNVALRDGVRRAYSAAAEDPDGAHPFPVGRAFAESLGYPGELLAKLPAVSVEAFAGVSNVGVSADIPRGATVLDLGCGGGLDSLLAAGRAGPRGHVIGVDFSGAMLDRARCAASEVGLLNVEFREADAERLPFDDASFDIALVNGIFNLNPRRDAILGELARVVRSGGVVFAAELILRGRLEEPAATDESNWFA
jgi:SAM-dependent methyltransferase